MILAAITTCKRPPEMVERAIKSVVAQTYTDWDLVVVDDSPSDYELRDDVRKMVEGWGERDSRIRYVAHDRNYGANHARNTALNIACNVCVGGGYEFIAYLDDDDEWLPQKLEKQIAKFNECDDDTALVSCGCKVVNEKTMEIFENMPLHKSDIKSLFHLALVCGTTSTPLMRTGHVNAVGGFDENLPARQEWELFIRLLLNGYKVEFIYEVLLIFHAHAGIHVGLNNVQNNITAHWYIINKYRDYVESNKYEYWRQMMDIAGLYCSAGEFGKGFKTGLKATSLQPMRIKTNVKTLLRTLLLMISPKLFYALRNIKRKLKGETIN